ncbi:MAG: CehA/McbA family metallohydrolase [Bacteroidetes bacterium]|nr:CehA/McbA family metallohydrolase [Bacteroidota bacterium]
MIKFATTTQIVLIPLIIFCFLVISVSGQSSHGNLQLTIIDSSTGEITPSRIDIFGSDEKYHIAEDALYLGGDCDMSDEGAGLVDLKTTLATFSQKVENPYTGTTQFYSNGNSKIVLPAGKSRIRVFKGPEYKMGLLEVEIIEGKTIQKTMELVRWINMPEKGWYSSDDHLHIPRPVKELDPIILKMMQAEGINVGNLLQFGKVGYFEGATQHSHGEESYYQEKDYIIAAGQENPRTHFLGHSITLGANDTINFSKEYLIYRLIYEQAVKQNAINGYAHFGQIFTAGEYGLPIVLPHNLLHFIEVLQFGRSKFDSWYDILNLGFRVSPTAGTDYPCARTVPGHERFYTKVDGEFTYENWLDGVRKGRTFVTTDPLLDFKINGKDLGEEIILDNADSVLIEIDIMFDPGHGGVNKIELVENGNVVRLFPQMEHTGEFSIKFKHAIKENSWLALRGTGWRSKGRMKIKPWNFGHFKKTNIFHSAPIYVKIKNAPPFTDHQRTKDVARKWLAMLEEAEFFLSAKNIDKTAGRQQEPHWDAVPKETFLNNQNALLAEIKVAEKFFLNLSQ